MPKTSALKIGRFNKKKLEVKGKVEQYFLAKVSGKVTSAMTKDIKMALNQAIDSVVNKPEEQLLLK
jgi:hypothetical protein